ncbi:MAG: AAA family ATPase [Candidatus Marinimicrobia bacterium]|jgi:broad-specificity NMP kinase|nr:AAA family ATPase [Candidatus Neomarinimicrobiota bacterium]MBT3632940.1 AAA family ATPase [Candidatus Neomarinimicrobiota bacterium]MBT3682050.1 AAA family ATPase [Candidatus Neomarinimicrobiota bacterium]MBT3758921.1 AAA family ATPase [Candidatus Neomarinimicrobiota bacterium]MBT3895180.1 AAA family ATPase [Candidatus Neomarinimicrobiota bacterium]
MILIINGSVGVGKTSISFSLQERFKKSIMLDGDYIGAVHPFQIYNEERTQYLYQTLTHLLKFHKKNGYSNFVINYVFETPNQLKSLIELLKPMDNEIHSFWLTCSSAENRERVRQRNSDDLEWELNRFKELANIQKENVVKGNIGFQIDTTNLTISQVTDIIWQRIQEREDNYAE